MNPNPSNTVTIKHLLSLSRHWLLIPRSGVSVMNVSRMVWRIAVLAVIMTNLAVFHSIKSGATHTIKSGPIIHQSFRLEKGLGRLVKKEHEENIQALNNQRGRTHAENHIQPLMVESQQSLDCRFDSDIIGFLAERGILNSTSINVIPLKKRYTKRWTANDTCWLANQLIVAEALGGYHPFCNSRAQNRNLLYALSTIAGSMRPAKEAVKLMGQVLHKSNAEPRLTNGSSQLEDFHNNAMEERERIIRELEGPGLSLLTRHIDEERLNQLKTKLNHFNLTQVENGWTVKGLNPFSAMEKGWHGSFSLFDSNELMGIKEVQQIAYDPFILNVLEAAMGVPPILHTVDVIMKIPNQDDDLTTKSSDKETWHKDFNSARTMKVFVSLTDALDESRNLRTFIPFTQDVLGPAFPENSNVIKRSGFKNQHLYNRHVKSHALYLSTQSLPEQYLKSNIFTQKPSHVFGKRGLVWVEDSDIFHRSESAKRGWQGLLLIEYTATGFCGQNNELFHKPLSKLPESYETEIARKNYPRLFQRMQIGDAPTLATNIPVTIWNKARPLEERFGSLLYNKTIQEQNFKDIDMLSFKITDGIPEREYQYYPNAACWEYNCLACLTEVGSGSCRICSEYHVCTCSCEHAFSCPLEKDPNNQRHELTVEINATAVNSSTGLIPHKIHQFWYSLDPIPNGTGRDYRYTHHMMNTWKSILGFDYHVYDHEGARKYLAKHFPSVVLEAYDTLLPGAFKSDLFRYAVLLIEGGIYADNDLYPVKEGLGLILKDRNVSFFASIDQQHVKERAGKRSSCLLNGLIGASPGHPVLAITLSRLVSQVLNRDTIVDIGTNLCPDPEIWSLFNRVFLYLTGPCHLGSSVNIALGRSPFSEFESGVINIESLLFPIAGHMRLIQWDPVEREEKHSLGIKKANVELQHPNFGLRRNFRKQQAKKVMRVFLIDEHGDVKDVVWSNLVDEAPRSSQSYQYGHVVNQVPTFHKYSKGVYGDALNANNNTSKYFPWYDFYVTFSDQYNEKQISYSTILAPGRTYSKTP